MVTEKIKSSADFCGVIWLSSFQTLQKHNYQAPKINAFIPDRQFVVLAISGISPMPSGAQAP